MNKKIKSISEKEKELLNAIEKAKEKLEKLQKKLKLEIGSLACKHNIHTIDLKILESEFEQIAKKYHG